MEITVDFADSVPVSVECDFSLQEGRSGILGKMNTLNNVQWSMLN